MINNHEILKFLVVDHQRELERDAARSRLVPRRRRRRAERNGSHPATATTTTTTTSTARDGATPSPTKAPRPAVSWR